MFKILKSYENFLRVGMIIQNKEKAITKNYHIFSWQRWTDTFFRYPMPDNLTDSMIDTLDELIVKIESQNRKIN